MRSSVIEIIDGVVYEVLDEQADSPAFVNTLIDAVELLQKAERICPDGLLRFHIHRALLELTTCVSHAAVRTRAVDSMFDTSEQS